MCRATFLSFLARKIVCECNRCRFVLCLAGNTETAGAGGDKRNLTVFARDLERAKVQSRIVFLEGRDIPCTADVHDSIAGGEREAGSLSGNARPVIAEVALVAPFDHLVVCVDNTRIIYCGIAFCFVFLNPIQMCCRKDRFPDKENVPRVCCANGNGNIISLRNFIEKAFKLREGLGDRPAVLFENVLIVEHRASAGLCSRRGVDAARRQRSRVSSRTCRHRD